MTTPANEKDAVGSEVEVVKIAPHPYNGGNFESEVVFSWDGDDNFLVDVTVRSISGDQDDGGEISAGGTIALTASITRAYVSLQMTEDEAKLLHAALGRAIA